MIEQVTLTALGEMFQAARSIMSWLGECAKACFSQIYVEIFHRMFLLFNFLFFLL